MFSKQYIALAGVCALYVCVWWLTPLPALLYNSGYGAKSNENFLQLPPKIKANTTTQPHTTTPTPSTNHTSTGKPPTPQGTTTATPTITTTNGEQHFKPIDAVDVTPSPSKLVPYKSLPLGIITHRPDLLTRLMENFKTSADFIDMRNVFVLEDGNTDATSRIIEKYHATRVTCPNQVSGLHGLNGNYKCLMDFMYTYTKFDVFIFLEEDLLLAPDFYSFFLQLAPVLMVDPSVFCISTWSDNGYQLYARDPSIIIRQEHFGGYGWAISRQLYEKEIRDVNWGLSSQRMWDQYMQDLTRDRVCLAPEVARTHHDSGKSGATISQNDQISSFDNIRLSDAKHVDLHPELLVSDFYDDVLTDQLLNGIFVACKGQLLDYEDKILIVYFASSGSNDPVWNRVTSWFGMWGLGNGGAQRGISRGIVSLNYAKNRVLLVGSASPLVKDLQKFKSFRPLDINHANSNEDGFGSHNCRATPKYLPPKMEVIVGKEDESCTQVCKSHKKKCMIDYLPHLNYCTALQEQTGCQTCKTIDQPNFALPSIVSENDSDFFDCMYTHHEKWLTCDAKPARKVKRVCTCVE